MKRAFEEVDDSEISLPENKTHPDTTTQFDVKTQPDDYVLIPDSTAILTPEEEICIVNWIMCWNARGFFINKSNMLNNIQKCLKKTNRKTPFANDMPSDDWYNSFLDRYPQVSSIIRSNQTFVRSGLTKEVIQGWFDKTQVYLAMKDLANLDGSRIFICDKYLFPLKVQSKCSIPRTEEPNEKKNYATNNIQKNCLLTVMISNANGQLFPPMILYEYKNLHRNHLLKDVAPRSWFLSQGYNYETIQESFNTFVAENFYNLCIANNVTFPIILFFNRDLAVISEKVNNFCLEHQIELIAVYPETESLPNPMNAFFKSLKINYDGVVERTKAANPIFSSMKKANFAPILYQALRMFDYSKILTEGFRSSGLYPFSSEVIDYSKFKVEVEEEIDAPGNDLTYIEFIEKNIDPPTLEQFKAASFTRKWIGEPADQNLFYFWLHLTDRQKN